VKTRDSKRGSADKVGVRRNGTPGDERARASGREREEKKVINFVTPDSICSASLPIPHIRQRASAKLFDAVAVKASVPRFACGEIKVGAPVGFNSRPIVADRGTVFDRGIHLNSIKLLLRSTLDISILNNSRTRTQAAPLSSLRSGKLAFTEICRPSMPHRRCVYCLRK